MGAGGSTNGAAGDEEVAYRPRPRYAGPGTQPVPPGHLRVRVPPGMGPGSEAAFTTPDGRVMRAIIPPGARAGSVFDVRLPPRRNISAEESDQVNDMAARQLSAMAAVRSTLGDVDVADGAIEGALVLCNFEVERAVAHLIESGALTQCVSSNREDAPVLKTPSSPKPSAEAYVNALSRVDVRARADARASPELEPSLNPLLQMDEAKPAATADPVGAEAKVATADLLGAAQLAEAKTAEAKTAEAKPDVLDPARCLLADGLSAADAKAAAAPPPAAKAAAPTLFREQNEEAVRSLAQSPLTTATADLLDFAGADRAFATADLLAADAKEAVPLIVEASEAKGSVVQTHHLEVVDSHVERVTLKDVRTAIAGGDCLGEGGLGSVHRGRRDGLDIALKRLHAPLFAEGDEFAQEVNVLARLAHRNLVLVLGYTCDVNERCLVYELCRGGSVFAKLRQPRRFGWSDRLDVADDISSGLKFLRENDVVHGGVTSSNVLLNSRDPPFVAKLGDAGLGRLLIREDGRPVIPSSCVERARGYVDPAYAKKGNVVASSDVYACGVVLLELLSGQLPFTPGREPAALAQFAANAENLLDPTLTDCPTKVSSGLTEVAAQCLAEKRKQRCKIRHVSEALHDLRDAMRNFRMASLSRMGLTPVRSGAASLQAVRAAAAFGGFRQPSLGRAPPQSPGTRLGAKPLPF